MTDGLDWPTGFDRTDELNREPNRRIKVSLAQAFDEVEQELSRLGVDEDSYRYDFDAQQRKTDQRPYSRANPDDPGFVLRWKMDAANYAVACDAYTRLRDNVRAVGLYLREKRKMEQRPVETGESEFANARLPPAGEDQAVVAAEAATPAHQILGVDPDASDDEVREAARERLFEAHPDHGGSTTDVEKVRNAREAMLDE
jgi:hypothetical protein